MEPIRMWIAAFAVLASAATPVVAQDLERGQAKSRECIACHGARGVTDNPTFPNIAGQNAAYLGIQLANYRSGARYHSLMTPIAQSLSEQDLRDLAAYFSSRAADPEPRAVRP